LDDSGILLISSSDFDQVPNSTQLRISK
jgi:hypothetical protein